MINNIPEKSDILNTASRIEKHIHHTPVLTSSLLNKIFNADLYFKCENLQKTGSFKIRGASNAVLSLRAEKLNKGVATHSSGNFAQALARSAQLAGVKAFIVMPETAPKVKVDAVLGYGGEITYCKPTLDARESTLKTIIEETGANAIHPYDDYNIIAGQATATLELCNEINDLDMILCPVGGGGLISGTALSAHYFGKNIQVVACEPKGADDAYQSFNAGYIIQSKDPNTIADGLLTSLGERNFPIIQKYVSNIVTVAESSIIKAMKMVFERMKIVIEPSSAVPLAAIIENKVNVTGKKTGIIISGGNVDLQKIKF